MKITLLLEPTPRSLPFPAGPERYQRLVNELGQHLGVAVPTIQSYSPGVVGTGYLLWVTGGNPASLLGNLSAADATSLAARTVVLDVSWQQALTQLEKYQFAAAVDSLRLSEWLARPSSSSGPFGLSRLSPLVGASCASLPSLVSRRYCLFQGNTHQGLPRLLAEYLRVHEEDRRPLALTDVVLLTRNPSSQPDGLPAVERPTVRRLLGVLRGVRERSRVSLAALAETAGVELRRLEQLEAGEPTGVTLGGLRQYAQALPQGWNWNLAGVGDAAPKLGQQRGVNAGVAVAAVTTPRRESETRPTSLGGYTLANVGRGCPRRRVIREPEEAGCL